MTTQFQNRATFDSSIATSQNRTIAQTSSILRLGTRGSLLARAQSQMIADELMRRDSALRVELVIVKTTGDRVTDRPLADIGGKGLFTKELEIALLNGEVDFAVHSYKDVPVTMPLVAAAEQRLMIAAVPQRESPWDVLAFRDAGRRLNDLPPGARVATGSVRRLAQLLEVRPDLRIEPIRGNIDTRLRKLRDGEFDAIVLAHAGLNRAGLFDPNTMQVMESMVPSPGQGALALECRQDDAATRDRLRLLHDRDTADCVTIEREVVLALNGDCHSPIGALATIRDDGQMVVSLAVAGKDGALPVLREQFTAEREQARAAVHDVLRRLLPPFN